MKNIKFKRYISCLLSSVLFSCCVAFAMEKSYKDLSFNAIKCSDGDGLYNNLSTMGGYKPAALNVHISSRFKEKLGIDFSERVPICYGSVSKVYQVNGKIYKFTYSSKSYTQEAVAVAKLLEIQNAIVEKGLRDNIVKIYDTVKVLKQGKNKRKGFDFCIVMEALKGYTLQQFSLELNNKLMSCPFSDVLDWMYHISQLLLFLKDNGLVYGDIHQGNIILSKRSGTIKPVLIDFGRAYTKESMETVKSNVKTDRPYDLEKFEQEAVGNFSEVVRWFYGNKNITEKDKISSSDIDNLEKCETFEALVESMKQLIAKCK